MVSISPFVNKMFYSRLFTASSLRQKARGQLSGGVSWVATVANSTVRGHLDKIHLGDNGSFLCSEYAGLIR